MANTTSLGNLQNKFNQEYKVCITDEVGKELQDAAGDLQPNSIIVSSPVNASMADIGVPTIWATDNEGNPVRLTYTIKEGNGLYVDRSHNTETTHHTDILQLNIDGYTIQQNEKLSEEAGNNPALKVIASSLIDDYTLVSNPDKENTVRVETSNLDKAEEFSYGIVMGDGKTTQTQLGKVSVITAGLDYVDDETQTPGIVMPWHASQNSKTVSANNGELSVITQNLSKATATDPGVVTVDGKTIYSTNGKIRVVTTNLSHASGSTFGIVMPDNVTLTTVNEYNRRDHRAKMRVITSGLDKATPYTYGVCMVDNKSIVSTAGRLEVVDYAKINTAINTLVDTVIPDIYRRLDDLDNRVTILETTTTAETIYSLQPQGDIYSEMVRPTRTTDISKLVNNTVEISAIYNINTNCMFKIAIEYFNNQNPAITLKNVKFGDNPIVPASGLANYNFNSTGNTESTIKFTWLVSNYSAETIDAYITTRARITVSSINDSSVSKSVTHSFLRHNLHQYLDEPVVTTTAAPVTTTAAPTTKVPEVDVLAYSWFAGSAGNVTRDIVGNSDKLYTTNYENKVIDVLNIYNSATASAVNNNVYLSYVTFSYTNTSTTETVNYEGTYVNNSITTADITNENFIITTYTNDAFDWSPYVSGIITDSDKANFNKQLTYHVMTQSYASDYLSHINKDKLNDAWREWMKSARISTTPQKQEWLSKQSLASYNSTEVYNVFGLFDTNAKKDEYENRACVIKMISKSIYASLTENFNRGMYNPTDYTNYIERNTVTIRYSRLKAPENITISVIGNVTGSASANNIKVTVNRSYNSDLAAGAKTWTAKVPYVLVDSDGSWHNADNVISDSTAKNNLKTTDIVNYFTISGSGSDYSVTSNIKNIGETEYKTMYIEPNWVVTTGLSKASTIFTLVTNASGTFYNKPKPAAKNYFYDTKITKIQVLPWNKQKMTIRLTLAGSNLTAIDNASAIYGSTTTFQSDKNAYNASGNYFKWTDTTPTSTTQRTGYASTASNIKFSMWVENGKKHTLPISFFYDKSTVTCTAWNNNTATVDIVLTTDSIRDSIRNSTTGDYTFRRNRDQHKTAFRHSDSYYYGPMLESKKVWSIGHDVLLNAIRSMTFYLELTVNKGADKFMSSTAKTGTKVTLSTNGASYSQGVTVNSSISNAYYSSTALPTTKKPTATTAAPTLTNTYTLQYENAGSSSSAGSFTASIQYTYKNGGVSKSDTKVINVSSFGAHTFELPTGAVPAAPQITNKYLPSGTTLRTLATWSATDGKHFVIGLSKN